MISPKMVNTVLTGDFFRESDEEYQRTCLVAYSELILNNPKKKNKKLKKIAVLLMAQTAMPESIRHELCSYVFM